MSAEAEWPEPVIEAQAGIVIFGFPGLVPDRVVVPLMSTAVLRFPREVEVMLRAMDEFAPVIEQVKRRILDVIERDDS